MFYMSPNNLWKWKMNVARAMGNSHDDSYVPDLVRAWDENEDARVRGMIAWAMGRLGGGQAKNTLERYRTGSDSTVREEVEAALDKAKDVTRSAGST
jgi:epoxyqueuosine reductase